MQLNKSGNYRCMINITKVGSTTKDDDCSMID
jgi:hypothetical protein